jgi:hypothetical protein
MQKLLSGVVMMAVLAGIAPVRAPAPVWAQTIPSQPSKQTQSAQQNAPGTGGVSKPGTPGLPGSKSGPAVRDPSDSSGTNTSGSASGTTSGPSSANPGPVNTGAAPTQDQARVPGPNLPALLTGPAARARGRAGRI